MSEGSSSTFAGPGGPEDKKGSGPEDKEVSGPEDKELSGPEDKELSGPEDKELSGPEDKEVKTDLLAGEEVSIVEEKSSTVGAEGQKGESELRLRRIAKPSVVEEDSQSSEEDQSINNDAPLEDTPSETNENGPTENWMTLDTNKLMMLAEVIFGKHRQISVCIQIYNYITFVCCTCDSTPMVECVFSHTWGIVV